MKHVVQSKREKLIGDELHGRFVFYLLSFDEIRINYRTVVQGRATANQKHDFWSFGGYKKSQKCVYLSYRLASDDKTVEKPHFT